MPNSPNFPKSVSDRLKIRRPGGGRGPRFPVKTNPQVCYNDFMDENPINHPGVPLEAYHTLGRKTFVMSFLGTLSGPIVLLFVSIALFIAGGEPFLKDVSGHDFGPYAFLGAWCALGLAVLVFLVAFFIAWLAYKNYKFYLSEDSLKIKRGILSKKEIAIPYRQIQDVDIERDLSYRMFGVSRLVILTAGNEEEKRSGDDESEGILPAIDKDLAEWLQNELLRRANVQKVTETKP